MTSSLSASSYSLVIAAPSESNAAALNKARNAVRELETQIADLQQRSAPAVVSIALAPRRNTAAGAGGATSGGSAVRLTSSSHGSAVRLDRSMSIDTSGHVDDLKSADERGREACLLAMLGDMDGDSDGARTRPVSSPTRVADAQCRLEQRRRERREIVAARRQRSKRIQKCVRVRER